MMNGIKTYLPMTLIPPLANEVLATMKGKALKPADRHLIN